MGFAPTQTGEFREAQPMPVHHVEHQTIPLAVTSHIRCSSHQPINLAAGEMLARAHILVLGSAGSRYANDCGFWDGWCNGSTCATYRDTVRHLHFLTVGNMHTIPTVQWHRHEGAMFVHS